LVFLRFKIFVFIGQSVEETGKDFFALYPVSPCSSISPKKLELAKQGMEDPTTVANVTITVLVTKDFR
jgi:hypothetical protein